MSAELPALFVCHREFLAPVSGGAQWCTREYRATLAAAGFRLIDVTYGNRTSLAVRLRRQVQPQPFDHIDATAIAAEVASSATTHGARWCFLNNADAGSLTPTLRRAVPSLRLVFLSHGVELTDVVNNLRLGPDTAPAVQRHPAWLGQLLLAEIAQRQALDAVVCIAQPDLEVERWLGDRPRLFLPRQIPADDLPAAPISGRIGCVATLNHGPNRDGIERFAAELTAFPEVELHLVGGPEEAGRALAAGFPAIRYAGPLDEAALRRAAATWRAFVNPIFCPARGASTKVATALGWGLPVLTTPDGARGYIWSDADLPLAATPHALAALAHEVATTAAPERWTNAAKSVRRLAPSPATVGATLRSFLDSLR